MDHVHNIFLQILFSSVCWPPHRQWPPPACAAWSPTDPTGTLSPTVLSPRASWSPLWAPPDWWGGTLWAEPSSTATGFPQFWREPSMLMFPKRVRQAWPGTATCMTRQTKSFCLAPEKFCLLQPETHKDTEKKTRRRCDRLGWYNNYKCTGHVLRRILYWGRYTLYKDNTGYTILYSVHMACWSNKHSLAQLPLIR